MCSYDNSFNACLHGKELMEVKCAKALNPVNGNDEREEVIIQIKDLPEGTEYFHQVHLMPTVKAQSTLRTVISRSALTLMLRRGLYLMFSLPHKLLTLRQRQSNSYVALLTFNPSMIEYTRITPPIILRTG